MKRFFLKSAALCAMLFAVLPVLAQEYVPRTTWPYMYEEFIPGKIRTYKGAEINYDRLNINLLDGRVHYVGDDGIIMQTDLNTVALLTIGESSFICVQGRMMKVLQNTASSAVLLRTEIDVQATNATDIGYTKSSIASSSGLSMSAINNSESGSSVNFTHNKSLSDAISARSEGEPLVTREIRGIFYRGVFVPASRTDVLNIPGIDKQAVKQYLKTEKIRFNRTEDLARLVEYLYTL